jgi:hypothetical protein
VPSHSARPDAAVILAGIIDVVVVLAFVLIGRASHGEDALGTLVTLWPFLVGLVVGWVITRAWRAPRRIVPTAVIIWAATVIVGLLLRVVSGQGIAVSFVIVTAVVLAVFLIGWRALSLLVVKLLRGS